MSMKLEQAARQALDALREYRDTQMIKSPRKAITALREALAELDTDTMLWDSVEPRKKAEQEPLCNQHPDAPHGFARNASHNAGRYVCECEGWEPEQEPVAVVEITYGREPECYVTGNIDDFPEGVFKLYAAPVRTKDLTDDEIDDILLFNMPIESPRTFARAVIAADREKNK